MYLKHLEIVGFKSFADRTSLDFEPGITAIVGPNGCGKSNVSDSIRWVLGEQSAKALRGSRMEDVIFSGTEGSRKPLGMAEVSVTFADCEKILGVEYNEVTITRRVFRSGEGQYFMNKTPCRLKDIHRLFMNTGIGTSSYSLMEQGRIDQILSSRPEDRRDIFEEASGITKFKADKKEAMRKLEQTEANLLRLTDVLREVKRQIISLQRQAGKARRFKELRDALRNLDVFASRERLATMDTDLTREDGELARLAESIQKMREEIQELEQSSGAFRHGIEQTEQEIEKTIEAGMEAQTRLDRTRDSIRINRERVAEFQHLSERDTKDLDAARAQIDKYAADLAALLTQIEKAGTDRAAAEVGLKQSNEALAACEKLVDETRRKVQSLRAEAMEQENLHTKLQNEMTQIEARERSDVIRRERLIAEQAQLSRVVDSHKERRVKLEEELRGLDAEVKQAAEVVTQLTGDHLAKDEKMRQTERARAELESQAAARNAQLEMVSDADAAAEDFPAGARLVLDPENPLGVEREAVLGPLTQHIRVAAGYRQALEAALRAWLDAVVVRDADSARAMLAAVAARKEGSVRLLAALVPDAPAAAPADGPGERLLDHVKCGAAARPLMERLLAGVRIVDSLDAVPSPIPAGATYVTAAGAIAAGDGSFAFCMADTRRLNPLARKHLIDDLTDAIARIRREIEVHQEALKLLASEKTTVQGSIQEARAALDEKRHALSLKQGEMRIVTQEAEQSASRLDTVTWEIRGLDETDRSASEARAKMAERMNRCRDARVRLRTDTETAAHEQQELEARRSTLFAEATERKALFSELKQRADHLAEQRGFLQARIAELETVVRGRSEGINSYRTNIEQLEQAVADAAGRIPAMEEAVQTTTARTQSLRKNREKLASELAAVDAQLSARRSSLEDVQSTRSEIEVRHAEGRMRRQNLVDRVCSDYGLTLDQIQKEPEPEWGETGKPERETIETTIAELRAKIEAIGPVNLVAIEEYQELEERHAFLDQQMTDLTNSKQQLMEMIKKINVTTSEMFTQTFTQINENFQAMFARLFNGGTAKLVLVNEEDVLECGIEIIARPPGKRLQTVSLLSGGERTLTAVALMFSIYMIRPSPFCLLDELDAALDESNIERFVRTLLGFVPQSQFVVITHNRRTIAVADTLYGVTMEESGVSKLVSMKFSPHENRPVPAGEASRPAAAAAAEPAAAADAPASP